MTFAPVAAGTFDGNFRHVWYASSANATASFASDGQSKVVARFHANLQGSEFLAKHPHQSCVLRAAAGDDHLAIARRPARAFRHIGRIGRQQRIPEPPSQSTAPSALSPWPERHDGRRGHIAAETPRRIRARTARGPRFLAAAAGNKSAAATAEQQVRWACPSLPGVRCDRTEHQTAAPATASITMLPGPVSNAITSSGWRAEESPSNCRCRRCSARCARSGDARKARNRGREPAARPFLPQPCRRDENPKPPVLPLGARRSRPRPSATCRSPRCRDTRPGALVIQRLAMASHQRALDLGPALCRLHRLGIQLAQREIEPRQVGDFRSCAFIACNTARRTSVRIREVIMRQQLQSRTKPAPLHCAPAQRQSHRPTSRSSLRQQSSGARPRMGGRAMLKCAALR